MSLVKLSAKTRNGKPYVKDVLIDLKKVAEPIFENISNDCIISLVDTPELFNGVNRGNNKVQYVVDETLAQIVVLEETEMFIGTVLSRDGRASLNTSMIFIVSKVNSLIAEDTLGSKFLYQEEGSLTPIEYIVSETPTQIMTAITEIYPGIEGLHDTLVIGKETLGEDIIVTEADAVVFEEGLFNVRVIPDVLNDNYTQKLQPKNGLIALVSDIPTQPLKYEALLSQNAPVVTTQTPTILAGQIWKDTVGTADAGDLAILGGYELMSGILGAVNATYRSAVNDTPTFNTSSFAYDGSPYVVSTDANGDFTAFIDTIGNPIWTYNSTASFTLTKIGSFGQSKTTLMLGNNYGGVVSCVAFDATDDDITLEILTWNGTNFVSVSDSLYYTPISIEIYP